MGQIHWKVDRETDEKITNPDSLKADELAQVTFQPHQLFVCETFGNCVGLSRISFFDKRTCVMLGKVTSCSPFEDSDSPQRRDIPRCRSIKNRRRRRWNAHAR